MRIFLVVTKPVFSNDSSVLGHCGIQIYEWEYFYFGVLTKHSKRGLITIWGRTCCQHNNFLLEAIP